MRRLGAHSFLLVTSDYHTRRAGSYFRPLANGMEMRVIAAPDEYFRWDSWWRNREGMKVFYMEWSKTLAKLAWLSFVGDRDDVVIRHYSGGKWGIYNGFQVSGDRWLSAAGGGGRFESRLDGLVAAGG